MQAPPAIDPSLSFAAALSNFHASQSAAHQDYLTRLHASLSATALRLNSADHFEAIALSTDITRALLHAHPSHFIFSHETGLIIPTSSLSFLTGEEKLAYHAYRHARKSIIPDAPTSI